ncbi:GNAT family N-acetyltransferase [Dermabacteraceae bacterium P13264]
MASDTHPAGPPVRVPGCEVPGVALRRFTPEDAEQVALIEYDLFPDDFWDIPMLLSEITHPDRWYVVAHPVDEPGRVIGYAGLMMGGDICDVQNIATTEPGKGIGTLLLNALHNEARARGAERMMLEVRIDNLRAQAVYRRHGYEQIAVRRGYYHGVDALIFSRDL